MALADSPRRIRRTSKASTAVSEWLPEDTLTGQQQRHRQQELLRRKWLSKKPVGEPMQSLEELAAIRPGTQVVAHLLRSPHSVDGRVARLLAHRLHMAKDDRSYRKGEKPDLAHVGKHFGPFPWDPTWASEATQEVTRYVFFDPGDTWLELIYRNVRMTTVEYRTSRDQSAASITPTGSAASVTFESKPEGYGVVWPVRYTDARVAIRRAMSVLPSPTSEDLAAVMGSEGRDELPARRLLAELDRHRFSNPQIVMLELGTASLAWARGADGGPGEMSFGDATFDRDRLYRLLRETGEFPKGFQLQPLLASAWQALHVPSG